MIRIGIVFGGSSREREVSFAGGRTVYDNLDKTLFEPVLLFVDSFHNIIELDWQWIYKGSIRDFYPPADTYPAPDYPYQIYCESIPGFDSNQAASSIGKIVQPHELRDKIDFAFLTLHGPGGEDGTIQGMLEWMNIPYSGEGIFGSSLGINKAIQKKYFSQSKIETPDYLIFNKKDWLNNPKGIVKNILFKPGLPAVIKSAHQGSSIGISIVSEEAELTRAVENAFFISRIQVAEWKAKSKEERYGFIVKLTDIRSGLGFPLWANNHKLYHPAELENFLDNYEDEQVILEAQNSEVTVIAEAFIKGREFSCIVVKDEKGEPFALPPTGIRKGEEIYDYRSKYLPGISRKITPIDASSDVIKAIRKKCEQLFDVLQSNVYCRIDGFLTPKGEIFLNDPNTTSGMMPSSFFFHQAAEAGLNPSQFLTFIIQRSLVHHIQNVNTSRKAESIQKLLVTSLKKDSGHDLLPKVAVIMGGYSAERHISVESGRNIYEKLYSAGKYQPIPYFLIRNDNELFFYEIPVNLLLKDNADDIKEKLLESGQEDWIKAFRSEAQSITGYFASNSQLKSQKRSIAELAEIIDFAFIALHGRPGEDGELQALLEEYTIPYNGSGVKSSQLAINKYETNKLLRKHGVLVAPHALVSHQSDDESLLSFPVIAKPIDDGCSAAVKKITSKRELDAYRNIIFRTDPDTLPENDARLLKLGFKEEFPVKKAFLIEELIADNGAGTFFEITGGLVTFFNASNEIEFEVFEASEALATGNVLSLEEKFLAGEGQNITPARYHKDDEIRESISQKVKAELKKVAQIAGVEGYARIDAFVRIFNPKKIEIIIIEINSLPGMTPATVIFHQAALNGYKPADFIHKIIEYGFRRNKIKYDKI